MFDSGINATNSMAGTLSNMMPTMRLVIIIGLIGVIALPIIKMFIGGRDDGDWSVFGIVLKIVPLVITVGIVLMVGNTVLNTLNEAAGTQNVPEVDVYYTFDEEPVPQKEVVNWDKSLSQEEIEAIYNKEPEPINYTLPQEVDKEDMYRMDELINDDLLNLGDL